jgi:DNA (cytosine-5)-methyltransferase 1
MVHQERVKPKLLDLFCCAGGAAKGYTDAGFEVVGVDLFPQPHYPYEFHQGDAIEYLKAHFQEFDVIHASPPCQTYSKTKTLHKNVHPDLVAPTREALIASGKPWVMENVVGAPLLDPLQPCGTEFDMTADDVDGVKLKLVRHRLFESTMKIHGNGGCRHDKTIQTATIYGAGGGWTPAHRDNPERRGGYIPATTVIQKILDIDWMNKHEMSQVVPPKFAEFIGRQIIDII